MPDGWMLDVGWGRLEVGGCTLAGVQLYATTVSWQHRRAGGADERTLEARSCRLFACVCMCVCVSVSSSGCASCVLVVLVATLVANLEDAEQMKSDGAAHLVVGV